MYSFQPLADNSQTHNGFYLMVTLALLGYGCIFYFFEEWPPAVLCSSLLLFLLGVTWEGSYSKKGMTPPINQPVYAKFIESKTEEDQYQCGSVSNIPIYCYSSTDYGLFKTDKELVWLNINGSYAWENGEPVILYKND